MTGGFRRYLFGAICVLLCWTLLFAPCVYFAKVAFAPSDAVSPLEIQHCPTVSCPQKKPSPSAGITYAPDEDRAESMQDVAASDKALLSFGSGAMGCFPSVPARPAAPAVPPPPPKVHTPSQQVLPRRSSKIPSSAGLQPSSGKPQLFDGYALLPQPNGKSFIYYDQTWPAYASHPYGIHTVGGYGCGPTSMAMIISNLTSSRVDPNSMADWVYKNGYCIGGRSSAYGLFPAASARYGINCATIPRSDKAALVSALKSGKLLLTVVGRGDFTRGRHFLLIRGITADGALLLADSGKYANSLVEWPYDRVLKQVANSYFWVFG